MTSKLTSKKRRDIVSIFIYIFLTIIVLFVESIFVLTKGLKKGILKKEILTAESNLGFDIDIIIRD